MTVQCGLQDYEQWRRGKVLLTQHAGEVGGNLVAGLRRHSVQYDRNDRAPVVGAAQHGPRHCVGVPSRGGHE
jgi:hypothetical protein